MFIPALYQSPSVMWILFSHNSLIFVILSFVESLATVGVGRHTSQSHLAFSPVSCTCIVMMMEYWINCVHTIYYFKSGHTLEYWEKLNSEVSYPVFSESNQHHHTGKKNYILKQYYQADFKCLVSNLYINEYRKTFWVVMKIRFSLCDATLFRLQ